MSTSPRGPDPSAERLLPSLPVTLAALLPVLLPLGVMLVQYLAWDLISPYAWAGFLPAVVACGWLSGLRGGLLSVLISVACAHWLLGFDESTHLLPATEARIFATLVFSLFGGVAVVILDQVHRERLRLHHAVRHLQAVALGTSTVTPWWRPWQRHFTEDLEAIEMARRELIIRRQCANAVGLPFATFAGDGRCLFANDAFLEAVQLAPGEWQQRNALEPSHFPGTGLSGAMRRLRDEAAPRGPVSVQIAGLGECQLIWVTTPEGGVALFTPLIPARTGEREPPLQLTPLPAITRPAPALAPAPAPPPAPAPVRRSAAGLRCLVVDDQELNRELLREILLVDGAVPTCVGSGREALAVLHQKPEDFDVVLMDLQMPGMDGYASARAIRSVVDSATLPILAITADGPGVPLARLRDSGMQGLLHKPLEVGRMLALLTELGGQQAGASL